MSKLVRISDSSYEKLNHIAKRSGISKQDLLDKAIKNYEREAILKQASEAYDTLRNNPQAWQEEQEERELWDTTLQDGLEDE